MMMDDKAKAHKPILIGESLTKNFGGLMAVSDANFHVHKGEIVGLIGPNGAGKTTLFNLISGAIDPVSGTIKFQDQDITRLKPHQICKKGIARTFQSVQLFKNMSVYENVRLALLFGTPENHTGEEMRRQINQLLATVNLLSERMKQVKDLSIGSQKRLEIARALATRPRLLLLDEVMAGLNPVEVEHSMQLIMKLRENGLTIFMIEHVMKAIMSVCDRIIVFHQGTKIAEGTPDEVVNNPTVIKIYLGH